MTTWLLRLLFLSFYGVFVWVYIHEIAYHVERGWPWVWQDYGHFIPTSLMMLALTGAVVAAWRGVG